MILMIQEFDDDPLNTVYDNGRTCFSIIIGIPNFQNMLLIFPR